MSAASLAREPAPQGWSEATEQFAAILGVDTALPEAVLRRAVVDSTFAHRLLVSRNAPRMLAALIADPANRRFDRRATEHADASPPAQPDAESPAASGVPGQPSSLALLGKATTALARWAATGFTHADAATLERRLSACSACPNLQAAPDSLAYRATGARGAGVCGLCGCPVERKARMSTENCPGAHPDNPAMTRWGDPIKA